MGEKIISICTKERDKTTSVKVMSNPRTDVITITPTRKKDAC